MRSGILIIVLALSLLAVPAFAGQTTANNYQCTVSAAAGTHDCSGPIVVSGSGSQRTAAINLAGGYVRLDALVDVCNPSDYWMHFGDSPTNDGNGGDYLDTDHDAELHTYGTSLYALGTSNNQTATPEYTDITNNVLPASGCHQVQFTVLESEVRFDDDGNTADTPMYTLLSPRGFESAPYNETDVEDSDSSDANRWYAGINRVYYLGANPGRTGSGTQKACFVLSKSTNPPAATISDLCAPPTQPVACFNWSPSVVRVGTTVTFNAGCSYDPNGTIVSYHWDFGDGTTATGPTPTHSFWSSQGYSVTLTVTDNEGKTGGFENLVPVLPNCSGLSCWQDN